MKTGHRFNIIHLGASSLNTFYEAQTDEGTRNSVMFPQLTTRSLCFIPDIT